MTDKIEKGDITVQHDGLFIKISSAEIVHINIPAKTIEVVDYSNSKLTHNEHKTLSVFKLQETLWKALDIDKV